MALETASYIAQLNATNPTSTDTVSQADDHLRLIKNVLKNTFPNLDQPVLSTPAQLNSPVPTGFIGMWSGSVATIPTGWVLCDGTNSTPDLRNRFIIGAGDAYAPGATGGSATRTLTSDNIPAHTHTFSGTSSGQSADHAHYFTTSVNGNHTHSYDRSWPGGGWAAGGGANNNFVGYGTSAAGDHQHDGWTGGVNSNHTHTYSGTTSSIGGGAAFSILPPYYALAYIMKT